MNSEQPRRPGRDGSPPAESDARSTGPAAESDAQATVRRLEQLQRHLSWLNLRRLARDLADDGLTPPQFFVLSWLSRCGPAPIHQLAEATFQIPATMTGIVDRLEAAGLVSRERDARDRRVVKADITSRGRDLVGRVRTQQLARFREAASTLSPRDRAVLLRLLERLVVAQGGELPGLEVGRS